MIPPSREAISVGTLLSELKMAMMEMKLFLSVLRSEIPADGVDECEKVLTPTTEVFITSCVDDLPGQEFEGTGTTTTTMAGKCSRSPYSPC